jgi:hypothetical protein
MDKTSILKALAVLSFALILFMPQNTDYWRGLLFFGAVFGLFWFIKS